MSSSDRRLFLAGLTALAGCGFTPVYAPDGPAANLEGLIDLPTPDDEEGFALVRRLEERLGTPDAPVYQLFGDIRIREEGVGFLPDGTISRFNVLGQVAWRLVRLNDEVLMLSGVEKSFTGYSTTSTTVATTVAQRDARRRLMVILADRIAADILLRSTLL